ncbi:hypothetical protein I4U23_005839 [Adineta vaga]|nr:hypothetical protein I4U23_005839 [Adineta vaga]
MSSRRFPNAFTFKCTFCKQTFSKQDTFLSHSIACENRTMNASSSHRHSTASDTNTTDKRKFDCLFDKASHVKDKLSEEYYQSEVDHVIDNLQFNIIVMGAPRVGKSQLINALCNGEVRAETSESLNSCTQKITSYVLESQTKTTDSSVQSYKITFYDTPGIESWNDNAGTTTMNDFIAKTDPICVIYCASPGSFAKLDQLHSILEYCKSKNIFCALVCTNMWSGNQRQVVMEEFQKQLAFFGQKIEKFSKQTHSSNEHKVIFFGNGALCTMVNSIEYSDPDFSSEIKPIQGVDELIHGIMDVLDHEKLLGWCYAVLHRRTYWEQLSQKVGGFFSLRMTDMTKLINVSPNETTSNFLAYLREHFLKKKSL